MEPKPSSSVLLISPVNHVLLLHRVQTSSSFPSAHVFPGGNVDAKQDGAAPDPKHKDRHVDSIVYRMAAIRETFEESGILLAKKKDTNDLLSIPKAERERARTDVHSGRVKFPSWLSSHGGVADTGKSSLARSSDHIPNKKLEGLIPFTRWITPPQVPKRFTTQMYIYFLPLPSSTAVDLTRDPVVGSLPTDQAAVIPSHDGGIEHTAARFLPAHSWISMAQAGDIILFPPQLFLLTLLARFLGKERQDAYSHVELARERRLLEQFILYGSTPTWGEACISPVMLGAPLRDGRAVLSLENPGNEVKDQDGKG